MVVFGGFRAAAETSVIDPTGASYTQVAASSEFNGTYTATNLFNFDVSSAVVGTALADSSEWAVVGLQTNAYVAFDIGNVHTVSSLFYAQRATGNSPVDTMDVAEIWASPDTAFDPFNPPATAPDVVVTITNLSSRVWTEYALANNLVGRYFLIQFSQTSGAGYAPGGDELRLGEVILSTPPTITQQPVGQNLFAGGTARMAVRATGSLPLAYQWTRGVTTLTNDSRISGATSANLQITALVAGDAGTYFCTVTNGYGKQDSSNAVVTIVAPPTTGVASVIVSNSPAAYWRFNESPGATVAADYAGGFDALYGVDSSLGNAGPQSPALPGFSATNTAVGTVLGDSTSVVTAPPLNLNTNTVTMIAWINRAADQDPYSSLMVWRDGGGAAYGMLAYGNKLCWIWNNLGWYEDSGLSIPQDQWCMATLVVTATNATLYLGVNGTLSSYVSPNSNPVGAFDSSLLIGCDNGTRVFNGLVDDVAIFAHALTAQEIQAIYAAGVGQIPVSILQNPVSRAVYAGGTVRFNVVGGGSTPQFQWKKGTTALNDGGNISGAQTATLTLANVGAADVANYSCVVSNSLGSLPSTAAALTVFPVPTTGYDGAVLSHKPLAYWQLNEAAGATNCPDYWGSFDGAALPDAGLGVAGPQPPDFPGFADTNTALQTYFADGNSSVAVPALNLNANTATFLMWILPASGQVGYSSLFANRSGGYAALNYLDDGATLSFQWDSYGWDSGIQVPSSQWSLVGMVITPTNTTLYLGTGGVLTNNTQVINNPVLSYAGPSYIGCDSGNNTRVFDGVIDDVAVFNRSLSPAEVADLYAAGLGQFVAPATLGWSVSGSNLTLTWSAPWALMQADNITGPWASATGVTSGAPIPMTAAKTFYRLQR